MNSVKGLWYDAHWQATFARARACIRRVRPHALADFEAAFRVLHTVPSFQPKFVHGLFDSGTLAQVRTTISAINLKQFELHEARRFGRLVVHGHPYFTRLQEQLVELVSCAAGEALEPSYNFLSRYTNLGVCELHMDAPSAKWTLDVCLDQSEPWPIYFSDVRPWPDLEEAKWREDSWADRLKADRSLRFTEVVLHPGDAVLFSGSSQWHYRDAIPKGRSGSFCDLLFFHFIPQGTSELVKPKNWSRLFGIPELATLDSKLAN